MVRKLYRFGLAFASLAALLALLGAPQKWG